MPSSYTPLLRLTLPADGELVGTWGQTVNNGITSLEEAAIAGTAVVPVTDGADTILTVANGAADQARFNTLRLTGALTAQRNVIVPAASKNYFIRNATTGNFGVQIKTAAGVGVVVPSAGAMLLYCDGVDVLPAINTLLDLTVTNGINGTPDLLLKSSGTTKVWVKANGNVGIGDSGPVFSLDVTGPANAGIRYKDGTVSTVIGTGASANGFVGTTTNHPLVIHANGGPVIYAVATGDAGLNDASPKHAGVDRAFSINGSGNVILDLKTNNDLKSYWYTDSTITTIGSPVNPLSFYVAGPDRLYLAPSGNVGIGTASPLAALAVQTAAGSAQIIISNAAGVTNSLQQLTFAENAQGTLLSFIRQYGSTFGGLDSGALTFAVGGSERMRIDSSGNVGIGTVTPTNFASYTTLEVKGKNSGAGGVIRNTSSDGLVIADFTTVSGGGAASYFGTTTNHPVLFTTNGVERMSLDIGGNLRIKNTAAAPAAIAGAGVLYVEGGALKYRGSSGTVTVLAPA